MKKISAKEIKQAILEQAQILKRKKELYEEVKRINSELKTLNESIPTGSFGFAVPGDKSQKTTTGFVAPQNISFIAQLEAELGPEETEENKSKESKK